MPSVSLGTSPFAMRKGLATSVYMSCHCSRNPATLSVALVSVWSVVILVCLLAAISH